LSWGIPAKESDCVITNLASCCD